MAGIAHQERMEIAFPSWKGLGRGGREEGKVGGDRGVRQELPRNHIVLIQPFLGLDVKKYFLIFTNHPIPTTRPAPTCSNTHDGRGRRFITCAQMPIFYCKI